MDDHSFLSSCIVVHLRLFSQRLMSCNQRVSSVLCPDPVGTTEDGWPLSPSLGRSRSIMEQDIQGKRKKLHPLQMQPLRRGDILFWGLFGCVPAILAAWALAAREIHFKVHPGMYFHATPDDAPFGYWFFIGLLCITTAFLWGGVLYSIFRLVFPRRHSTCEKGAARVG